MTRVAALQPSDRLAAAALFAGLCLALIAAGSGRTFGLFTGTSDNPGNTLATSTSFWFDATGAQNTICTGTNVTLSCPFGARGRPVTVTAKFNLTNKWNLTHTFTLAVVNGTGPAGLSTIVTATFPPNVTSKSIAAGTTQTANVKLTTVAGTAVGTYTGWVRVTDTNTGRSADVPISVTVQ